MSEPTPDDKIARLVHLVLEAVDQRLEGLRQELQQLHQRLGEVEKAVARGSGNSKSAAPAPDPRVDGLTDEIRSIRAQLETLASRPAPVAPAAASAPVPVAPVIPSAPAHTIDTSLPTLQPLMPSTPAAGAHADSTGAMARPIEPLTATTTGEHPELIDLDRLNDLLTAKLGQLNLPRPS